MLARCTWVGASTTNRRMFAYAVGLNGTELLGKFGTTQADIECVCNRLQSQACRIRLLP
jgi:hypothetical protein